MRRAKWQYGEWRGAKHRGPCQHADQLSAQQRARPVHGHGDRDRWRGEQSRGMDRVAESHQIRHEREDAIRLSSRFQVEPAQHEPGGQRQTHERERIHLLHDYTLVPHRERRCAEQCCEPGR